MFHKKTTANLITTTFAILLIAQIFGFLISNINNNSASAERGVNPLDNLQISIPGLDASVQSKNAIGEYIRAIYKYAIGSVGILATVVMMYAGMLWITAAGNTEQIGKAKSYIAAALSGTVLALTSWMILYQVNPDLTSFKPISPTSREAPPDTTIGCCAITNISSKTTKENCDTLKGHFYPGYSAVNNKCLLYDENAEAIIGDDAEKCYAGNCLITCNQTGYLEGNCVNNKCKCSNGTEQTYTISNITCNNTNCEAACISNSYKNWKCVNNTTCICNNCTDTLICPKN